MENTNNENKSGLLSGLYNALIAGITIKRVAFAFLGEILVAFAIGLGLAAGLGVDAATAMFSAINEATGIPYGTVHIIMTVIFITIDIILYRRVLGLGSLINLFLLGYAIDFFKSIFIGVINSESLLVFRIIALVISIIVISLGISLYQHADIGFGPYDAISFILDKKTKLKYLWCRIITDGTCAIVTVLLGGLLGIGTIIYTFFLGPFISFFDKFVSDKIMPYRQ